MQFVIKQGVEDSSETGVWVGVGGTVMSPLEYRKKNMFKGSWIVLYGLDLNL